MSDTRSPPPTKRGISFSMSVVLPLPDQPAKPKIFTGAILSRSAAARASGPGGAAQAVLAEDDAAPERGVEVEVCETSSWLDASLLHSLLNATIGSILAARRAGIHAAISATAKNRMAAPQNVTGSVGPTP